MQLNTQQTSAVTAPTEGVHLIEALAGSGKTTLLRHRVRFLLRSREQQGDYSSTVLVMAFNKDVKETINELLEKDLTSSEFDRVSVRTFHGHAWSMIKKYRKLIPDLNQTLSDLQLPKSYHLATSTGDYMRKQGHKLRAVQIKVLMGLDDQSRNLNLTIKQLFEREPRLTLTLKMDHYEALSYIKQMRKYRLKAGTLTFGDMLPLANSLPDECFKKGSFTDILVDELQDLNYQQRELVGKLLPYAQQFTGVGDPRQSIYSFQGCDDKIFEKLVDKFPNAKIYPLTKNYRCTDQIIGLANEVLVNELASTEILVGTGATGPSPSVFIGPDSLIQWIKSQKASGRAWKDIAILYRARAHTPDLEIALTQAGLPFTVSSNSFFEQSAVQDVLAYFYLFYHPKPDYGYWRHISSHFMGMTSEVAQEIWDMTSGKPLLATQLPKGVEKWVWNKFQDTLDHYHFAKSQGPNKLARLIVDTLYDRWAFIYGDNMESLEYHLEIANALCAWIDSYGADGYRVIQTVEMREAGKVDQDDAIEVVTVHKSKGREWPAVAIWGLKEGMFPHPKADIAEERRLLYVAVTRAKEDLALVGLVEADRKSTILKYIPDYSDKFGEMF